MTPDLVGKRDLDLDDLTDMPIASSERKTADEDSMSSMGRQKHCVDCGSAIPDGAKYCPSCGREQ